jgi:hypothetical protein
MYLNRGIQVPKTIHGKSLIDFLVIDTNELARADACTQTSECTIQSPTQVTVRVKPKATILSTPLQTLDTNHDELLFQPTGTSICSSASNTKKDRLLVGKNAMPSVSTLERQLDSIIHDACEFSKQEEEIENEQKQFIQFHRFDSASNDNDHQVIFLAPAPFQSSTSSTAPAITNRLVTLMKMTFFTACKL